MNHTEIGKIETPIEASLIQSEMEFFTIEGNKLLAFPVFGCSAKIELITGEHSVQVDYIKGSGGMFQSCPRTRSGNILSNIDGRYFAVQINESSNPDWKLYQNTPQALFSIETPSGFTGTVTDWEGLTNVLDNPANILLSPTSSADWSTKKSKVITLVLDQPSAKQRIFLSQTVENLKPEEWVDIFKGLETPDQTELLQQLTKEFIETTSNTAAESHTHTQRNYHLQDILIPLVNPTEYEPFLKRVLELQQFLSTPQLGISYAKTWAVDPEFTSQQACKSIILSESKNQNIIPFTLIFAENTTQTCPAAKIQSELMKLEPCCNNDCDWLTPLPSREELIQSMLEEDPPIISQNTIQRIYLHSIGKYPNILDDAHKLLNYRVQQSGPDCVGVYKANIPCSAPEAQLKEAACLQTASEDNSKMEFKVTIDDDNQTIHNIRSTGTVPPPKAIITRTTINSQKQEEKSEYGYTCTFEGQSPFYGVLNQWSVEWSVNGTIVDLESSISHKIMENLVRSLTNSNPENIGLYTHLPLSHYTSGDKLSCALTITKIEPPSVDTILETKSLILSRTYTTEPLTVP